MYSMSTANSSPPRRAAVSACRMQPSRTSATARSNSSPVEWPRLSLTVLKLSRSKNMTAIGPALRSMRATAWFRRSAEERLVGQAGERVVEGLIGQLRLEPCLFGAVAEAPDAADHLAVDDLRFGHALEDSPVLEFEDVGRLHVGVEVELLDLGHECLGMDELVDHATRACSSGWFNQ